MQSSNEEKDRIPAKQKPLQDTELNETWRDLLGLSGPRIEGVSEGTPAEEVEPLEGDPWGHLVHTQGMQVVDLQKVNLHDLYPVAGDDDVEHALDLMRESTGQLRALNEQARDKEK